jgi:hypothetical protein
LLDSSIELIDMVAYTYAI